MAKNNTPEVKTEQKVQTKYDRKMEARKQQKIQDARQEKITKIATAAIGIALAAAIVISVAVSVISKNTALNGTYVKIGDHELTRLEYDYYYNNTVNSYLMNYSSLLPYMGLDTSGDFAEQEYMDGLTWKDMFDEMTVDQIKQNKAIGDDADKAGFTYDTTAEYESFVDGVEQAAQTAGISVKEYYKSNFGTYATEKNIEPFVKEGLFASAYANELYEKNTPSDEEIKAYYEENKQSYDKVDFRSFTFTTGLDEEATDEEISKAMDEMEKKAEAMMKARQDGGDFEELCIEYASEDTRANYEDAETEYSLSEGRYYTGITAVMAQWLYEEGRKEGEIAVLRDDSLNQYYVVEFISKYYDEADDANISSTIANQRVNDYVASLVENYEVTDVKGELKYLTVSTEEENSEEAAAEETDAEETAGEAGGSGDAAEGTENTEAAE